MEDPKEIFEHMKHSMDGAIESIRRELASIRTGKANPALLDSLRVEYYGQEVPLKQVASIAVPEPTLITVQPWDKEVLKEVEKSIRSSDLGLNPQSDGQIIRIPIPPLTEERRKELVKIVKAKVEEGRVAIRNVRRHANDSLKKLEKDSKISEDQFHDHQREIQKTTDEYVEMMDSILKAKEEEILEM
jgi:ribosome recycling factor